MDDPLDLRFVADKYGPYSDRLRHLLNGLDGSYLHCDKRLGDAGPSDTIWFDEERRPYLDVFLKQSDARPLQAILDRTAKRIDGFESPLGMELLATVHWVCTREGASSGEDAVRRTYAWNERKKSFDRKQIAFARGVLASQGWL